jgi:hypothetical protein
MQTKPGENAFFVYQQITILHSKCLNRNYSRLQQAIDQQEQPQPGPASNTSSISPREQAALDLANSLNLMRNNS